jgi:hypothetical protein
MDGMTLVLRLSRIVLFGITLVLGSLGVFCLFWSCKGAHLAAYAIVCLGSATAMSLAFDETVR